jgi:pimeloyl-ACP methyl ester carboxylesterase
MEGHLVGVSLGGMIAQLVALKYPDWARSIVLLLGPAGAR